MKVIRERALTYKLIFAHHSSHGPKVCLVVSGSQNILHAIGHNHRNRRSVPASPFLDVVYITGGAHKEERETARP